MQARTGGRVILLFDQFEEFFTYPTEQQGELRRQLAEMLYTAIPQSIRNRMSELSPAERNHLVAPLDVKVLFSIRADRLSLLDSMKVDLPDILHRRYELRPLSPEQAKTAMVRPASLHDKEFVTEPFGYTDVAIEKVVQHLLDPITGGVEAFLLQVVCLSIESRIEGGLLRGRIADPFPKVDASDWPPLENIMDDYYHQQIAKITPAELRPQAYRLIEDRLMFVHPETGETRRLSVDSRTLQAPQFLLDSLENQFLLRREANALGGYNYELCHDRLLEPALTSRAKWMEQEDLKAAEQAAAERIRQVQELQRVADLERNRRRRANVLAIVAVVGLVVAAVAGILAIQQRNEAVRQQEVAEKAKIEAEAQRNVANDALQKIINARKEKIQNQIKLDEEAGFIQSATNNKAILAIVDSLQKSGTSLNKILIELEK